MPVFTLKPVRDADGNVVLWDVYAGEKWLGSRRTVWACMTVHGVAQYLLRSE